MPAQVVKSGLLAKIAGRVKGHYEANTKHKKVEMGNAQLPAGIENGIAQLFDMHFGTYEKGEFVGQPFFMAQAVVREPAEFAGVHTKIGPEPICDTPKSQGKKKTLTDHYDWVCNEVGKFTGSLDGLGPENIEKVALALTQKKPHLRFRTWSMPKPEIVQQGGQWFLVDRKNRLGPYASKAELLKKNPYAEREPMIFHEWNGIVAYVPKASANGQQVPVQAAGVQDGTGGQPDANPENFEPPADARTDAGAEPSADAPAEWTAEELEALVEAASSSEKDVYDPAIARMEEIAAQVGIEVGEDANSPPTTVRGAPDWATVAQWITQGGVEPTQDGDGAGEPEPEAPPEPELPKKGQVVSTAKKDAKGKPVLDKSKKPVMIECKIIAVDEKKSTVKLQDLTNPKLTYSRTFDELS